MNFWQGKRVLLTGHTGFKGSWLTLWLHSLKAELIGYSLAPPTEPNLFDMLNLKEYMTSIVGDVRDYDHLLKVLQTHQPEIVIHMAAQPLVRYSYKSPVETYATNVLGTVHLLEAIRQVNSVRAVLNVTTDKCYENKEWLWGYRENDRLGGHDPYSNSKACSELVTSAYFNSYFKSSSIGLATARAGNVIGGGDWAEDRLIPDIIRAQMKNETVTIRHPYAIRPWQHVLEPLSGYLLLSEKLFCSPKEFSGSWNFGPDENDVKPVHWIADYLTSLWQNKNSWTHSTDSHLHEANYLKLDCSKAKSQLGWHPRWNLERSLKETFLWFNAFQKKQDMRAITLTQINNFNEKIQIMEKASL